MKFQDTAVKLRLKPCDYKLVSNTFTVMLMWFSKEQVNVAHSLIFYKLMALSEE